MLHTLRLSSICLVMCLPQTIDTKYDASEHGSNMVSMSMTAWRRRYSQACEESSEINASHDNQSLLDGYQSSLSLDTQVVTCATITGGFKQSTTMV